MAEAVTIRMADDLVKAVEARARRMRRSRSDVTEELVRIGLAVLRYPGITFVDGPAGLRAHVAGTGLDVWEVAMVQRALRGEEEAILARLPQLSRRQLRTALAYVRDHAEEVDAILRDHERSPEAWSAETGATGSPPR